MTANDAYRCLVLTLQHLLLDYSIFAQLYIADSWRIGKLRSMSPDPIPRRTKDPYNTIQPRPPFLILLSPHNPNPPFILNSVCTDFLFIPNSVPFNVQLGSAQHERAFAFSHSYFYTYIQIFAASISYKLSFHPPIEHVPPTHTT